MNNNQPQSFDNHSRLIPLWHFVTAPVIIVIAIYDLYIVVTDFSFGSLVGLAGALALASIWVYARVFALTAQDRIIRLEEQLRLERLLPDELKSRIDEISVRQFVGLRFASDDELPDLTAKVLSGELNEPTDIKKNVQQWRADSHRV